MNFKIVAINETTFWNEQIVAKAGRIYGLYLFDADRKVHCCELTPSYELYFIESVTERIPEDSVVDAIVDGDLQYRDEVVYRHCYSMDRLDPRWFVDIPVEHSGAHEEDLSDWELVNQGLVEYLSANQVVPDAVPSDYSEVK